MPGSALSPLEREEIRACLVDDPIVGFASIAIVLGRNASTISREVRCNGGRDQYRVSGPQQRADHERLRFIAWVRSLLPSRGSACPHDLKPVSYTHLRAHETVLDIVCR